MGKDRDEDETDSQKTPEQRAAEAERARAEADQARAEALKAAAETQRIMLDIKQAELSLKQAELSLLQAEMTTRGAEIDLEKKEQTRKDELAEDRYHFAYTFDSPVGEGSVTRCIKQLALWSRTKPGCAIEIVFDSPGGSVIDGMHLFDYFQLLRQKGHHLTFIALGYAASMAGILLQAADERVIGRESYVLIHEISTFTGGKIAEIEDEVKFIKKIQKRVADIFVSRAEGKMTRSYFQSHWRRKDWWLDSEEALKLGICDRILTPPVGISPKRKRAKK